MIAPWGLVRGTLALAVDVGFERLRDVSATLPGMFDESSTGVALVDFDGRFLHLNDAFVALVGRSRAEVLAGRLDDFLASEQGGSSGAQLCGAYMGGLRDLELPFRGSRGELRWLRCKIHVVQAGGAARGAVFLSAVDVTQQRVLEAAMRTSTSALRALLESVPEGIVVVDGEGRIKSVNPRITELFGYRPQELEGQPIEVLVPVKLRGVHAQYRSRYLDEPRTRPMGQGLDLTARRKDGSEFPVEIGLGSLHDHGTTSVTCVITDISQRKATKAEQAEQAVHDLLTGLPNRTLFADRTRMALTQAARHGGAVAVLSIDLDRFQAINQSLGHPAGDAVLREVGSRIQASVRAQDTIARFEGDTFGALCGDLAGEDAAVSVAERIMSAVSRPLAVADHRFTLTTSIGMAIAPPEAANPEALLHDADSAMRMAKRRGGGCVERPGRTGPGAGDCSAWDANRFLGRRSSDANPEPSRLGHRFEDG